MASKYQLSDFSSISWLDDKDWVFTPTQNRSKKTLQKILVAAKELFISKSFEEVTIAEISRQSGVSSGSIYNLFSEKSAIFRALFEHYRITREAQIEKLIDRYDWLTTQAIDIVRFHIEIIFSSSREDANFLRLVERQRTIDPILYDIQAAAEEEFCKSMLKLYNLHAREFTHPDLKMAVLYLHYVIRGSALWSILPQQPNNQFLNVTNQQYQDETIRMACSYLGLSR